MSYLRTTILFHGNCIDGWFSAYFAYCNFQHQGGVQMFPIAPSQSNTWPTSDVMEGTHIWLLDVSVPEHVRTEWMKSGALSVQCIDHHATAVDQWPADACPIDTECCAALQTYRHFYPEAAEPEWLHSIDRVDRWVNVTYEDRCLREFLHEIARKPVQHQLAEAIQMTNTFLYHMDHQPELYKAYCAQGEKDLLQKDTQLLNIIGAKGNVLLIEDEHIGKWELPTEWLGRRVFLMDTTDVTLDTTEASHLVFTHQPMVDVFINYRNKTFYNKADKVRVMKSMTVYSARSREIDLTNGTVFRGHRTSAGASLVRGEAPLFPFL